MRLFIGQENLVATASAEFNSSSSLTSPLQHCLRIDVPKTRASPQPYQMVLCFMEDGEYNRAARAIRNAQFVHFEKLRLESQPAGAITTGELFQAACADAKASTTKTFTQDLKVKEADNSESLKCVSIDKEILVIEAKSKSFMRSKRTTIQTLGLPISFISPVAIALPTQVADVTFTFANSHDRDVFAFKIFLNSKGDPRGDDFSGSGAATSSQSSSRVGRPGRAESVLISR